jgi:hypothetical protein
VTGDDALAALEPIANLLDGLGVSYHIGGSLASSAHGIPRSTLDVDLVADLRPAHVDPLVGALAPAYYLDEEAVRAAIRDRSTFNAIHLATLIKVDVFVAGESPFDRSELARARLETLTEEAGARTVFPLKSPEDLVLRKLLWFRAGGETSERQWGDVVGVIRVQAEKLDWQYRDRWAEELELAGLLARARLDAGGA